MRCIVLIRQLNYWEFTVTYLHQTTINKKQSLIISPLVILKGILTYKQPKQMCAWLTAVFTKRVLIFKLIIWPFYSITTEWFCYFTLFNRKLWLLLLLDPNCKEHFCVFSFFFFLNWKNLPMDASRSSIKNEWITRWNHGIDNSDFLWMIFKRSHRWT